MTYKISEAIPDDLPFLAQLTGIDLPTWLQWNRRCCVLVARAERGVVGVLVVRGRDDMSFEIVHLEVMKFYRRLRMARMLWNHAIEHLLPTTWHADVPEGRTDVQCTLRQFGFRCVGTQDGGRLQFIREG